VSARDAVIDLDPPRPRRALVNLLDIALRHTPAGGTVSLVATTGDTGTRMVVSDTGPGFATAADADVLAR
jgi:signal transduction histidine kinase